MITDSLGRTEKVCRICLKLKPLTEFYGHSMTFRGKLRFHVQCKLCQHEKLKQRRKAIRMAEVKRGWEEMKQRRGEL